MKDQLLASGRVDCMLVLSHEVQIEVILLDNRLNGHLLIGV